MHALSRIALTSAVLLASACIRPDGAQPVLAGDELFRACTACHGHEGEGNPLISAPVIAGLPDWYLEAEITKFRTGIRGAHPDDYEGLRMRPMSRQLMNQGEIKSVVSYISQMPIQKPSHNLQGGDVQAGQTGYAVCVACHGAKGEGNVAQKAPPLIGQSDWYLFSQLKKFKAGIRGGPQYVTGSNMRAMSLTLTDERR